MKLGSFRELVCVFGKHLGEGKNACKLFCCCCLQSNSPHRLNVLNGLVALSFHSSKQNNKKNTPKFLFLFLSLFLLIGWRFVERWRNNRFNNNFSMQRREKLKRSMSHNRHKKEEKEKVKEKKKKSNVRKKQKMIAFFSYGKMETMEK